MAKSWAPGCCTESRKRHPAPSESCFQGSPSLQTEGCVQSSSASRMSLSEHRQAKGMSAPKWWKSELGAAYRWPGEGSDIPRPPPGERGREERGRMSGKGPGSLQGQIHPRTSPSPQGGRCMPELECSRRHSIVSWFLFPEHQL